MYGYKTLDQFDISPLTPFKSTPALRPAVSQLVSNCVVEDHFYPSFDNDMVTTKGLLRIFWPSDIVSQRGEQGVLIGWRNAPLDIFVVTVVHDVEVCRTHPVWRKHFADLPIAKTSAEFTTPRPPLSG